MVSNNFLKYLVNMNKRLDFPLLAKHPELHYLDSAASAQKPAAVLEALTDYYITSYSNPHRGAYDLSVRATERYHDARNKIARFFGTSDTDCLIFTRGTTEALNLVATGWGRTNVQADDEIIVTGLEHHANFVTWQSLAAERGAKFKVCELTPSGEIDLIHLKSLISPRTRIVAVAHVSNAIGTINPIADITSMVRTVPGAIIVCDGAQSAPHLPIDFDSMDVDFYAFSGHKMCGPMGIGGLIGKRALLESMEPYQFGGDMIEYVYDDHSTWNSLPYKFEAGTPNAADAYALGAAVAYLESIGMENIRQHEQDLLAFAHHELEKLDGVKIFGPAPDLKSGVVSFVMDGVHPHDIATILDEHGVCIRAGHHCTQPLMRRLGVPATARASFYLYNTEEDVAALVKGITQAAKIFSGV